MFRFLMSSLVILLSNSFILSCGSEDNLYTHAYMENRVPDYVDHCNGLREGAQEYLAVYKQATVNHISECESVFVRRVCIKNELSYTPAIDFKPYLGCSTLPHLTIQVEDDDLNALQKVVRQAKKDRVYISEGSHYKPISISINGKPYKGKMRPKGDWSDHMNRTWSKRIVLEDKLFKGMRKFSLQNIDTRGQDEALLHLHMKSKDVIAPKTFYVTADVNGDWQGLLAIEEHSNEEVIKAAGRPDGPILAREEDYMWNQKKYDFIYNGGNSILENDPTNPVWFHAPFGNRYYLPYKIYQSSKWFFKKPKVYQQAMSRIRGFQAGTLAGVDVFDLKIMAKWMAITSCWHASHGFDFQNLRLYFNPKTQLFEPISFDNLPFRRKNKGLPSYYILHGSKQFLADYQKELLSIKNELESGELQQQISQWHKSLIGEHTGRIKAPPKPHQDRLLGMVNEFLKFIPEHTQYTKRKPVFVPKERTNTDLKLAHIFAAFYYPKEKAGQLEFINPMPETVTIESIKKVTETGEKDLQIQPFELPFGVSYKKHIIIDVDTLAKKEAYIIQGRLSSSHELFTEEALLNAPIFR